MLADNDRNLQSRRCANYSDTRSGDPALGDSGVSFGLLWILDSARVSPIVVFSLLRTIAPVNYGGKQIIF